MEATAVAFASAIPLPAAVSMGLNCTVPEEMVLYRWVWSCSLACGTWWSYTPTDNIWIAGIQSGWVGSQMWDYSGLALKLWLPTKHPEKHHQELQGWGCESILDRCSPRVLKVQTALEQSQWKVSDTEHQPLHAMKHVGEEWKEEKTNTAVWSFLVSRGIIYHVFSSVQHVSFWENQGNTGWSIV